MQTEVWQKSCRYNNNAWNYVNWTLTLSNENEASDGDDDQSQDLGHSEDILDSSGSSHTDQVHKGQYT